MISRTLIDSYINEDRFALVNTMLNMQWDERENQKPWNSGGIFYIKTMETHCVSWKILQTKL